MKLLDNNSPVGRIACKILDLMLLNMLWLVCCAGIITIGASTSAMYAVTLKMVRNQEGNLLANFFHSFRENFRASIPVTLIYLGTGAFLLLDIYLFNHLDLGIWEQFKWVLYIALAVHFLLFSYVFPVQAKFYNSTGTLLKNALILAIHYPVNTLVVGVINAIPLIGLLLFPELALRFGYLWLFVGFAAESYWNSSLFVRIFDQLIPEESENIPEP